MPGLGACAGRLRQERFETFRRFLELARERSVDACIIAGDLFEDSQVEESVVRTVVEILECFPSLRVFIVPGNHDPETGPGSVWNRAVWKRVPENHTICREAGVWTFAGGAVLASPLHQKVSTADPSLKLAELARDLPGDAVRIGITHGAPAVPGKHQPNDFPIALDAASRAGLDYLALGHWHQWQTFDGGRMLMPGTPEPDGFEQSDAGCAAFVQISDRGALPEINREHLGRFQWKTWDWQMREDEPVVASWERESGIFGLEPERTVLRVVLRGAATAEQLAEAERILESARNNFAGLQVIHEAAVALPSAERLRIQEAHPFVGELLEDLDRIESWISGGSPPAATVDPLRPSDVQALCAAAKIDFSRLSVEDVRAARRMVFEALAAVRKEVGE